MNYEQLVVCLTKCLLLCHELSSLQDEIDFIKEKLTMSKTIQLEKDKKSFSHEIHLFFTSLFKKTFQFYCSMPIFEVFCHDNPSGARKTLDPPFRSAIQTSLSSPFHYLSQIPDGELNWQYPDTCILYKLHLESGKMINMYDWFMSFKTIVEEEQRSKKKKSKSSSDDILKEL